MHDPKGPRPDDADPPDEKQLDDTLDDSFPSSDPPGHSSPSASPEEVGPPRSEDEVEPDDARD